MTRWFLVLFLLFPGMIRAQEKITYQDHVRPLLENRCLNCHNPEKKKGGLDLTTYGGAMAGGSGGVCLEPGDPAASKLFQAISHTAEPYMPPKSDKLPQNEIDVISKWIAGGVLDTATSTAKVKKKADFGMAAGNNAGKPDGPAAMPEHLLLDPVVCPLHSGSATAIAHSPWAPLVAIGSAKQVLLYHSGTKELLGVLPFPDGGFPECVTFTRNGALVLASGGMGGKKGVVAVWDVKTGRRIITLGEEFESIATADITPDYRKIAIGTREKRVKIYDTASGQKLMDNKKHTDWVTAVAFSPDGVLLATGDRNGGVYVWETATGGEFYNLKGHEKMIAALAWRADSNLVASGSEDGTFIWWEMINGGQVKKVGSHGGVLSLNFGQDGRMVSAGRDGHVRIWDGKAAQTRDWVPSAGKMIVRATFTHEGKTVITGSETGEIKVWDSAKEAPALGELIYNPPSIDTRLEVASKEIAAMQAGVEKAKVAVAEKEKLMADAKAKVEAVRKAITDADVAAAAMATEAAVIKAEAEKMGQTRQDFTAGLEATKQQLAAAAIAPPPAPLPDGMPPGVLEALKKAAEAEKSLNALTKLVLEDKLKTLSETIAKCDAEITARQQTVQQHEQQAAALRAKKDEMAKSMPEKERKMQEAEKAVAGVKPLIDAALGATAAPQRALQFWQAAKQNKDVLVLKDELAALKERIEDLKGEIPALEAEIKNLSGQKTATPPAKPEDATKMDKKLAAATARLTEAKKELAAAEPQLPEKEKAVEATWQKYLSMLPK